jgi:hypothetical protein
MMSCLILVYIAYNSNKNYIRVLRLLLFPMLSKHPERLTGSYRRYLIYHRHMQVIIAKISQKNSILNLKTTKFGSDFNGA